MLVFLTGREEIDTAIQAVADRAASLPPRAPKILALPLYATLPVEEQEIIFEPPPKDTRKVIFATNIAEASVTIDGIKYVVDSGFVKVSALQLCAFVTQLTHSSKPSTRERAWMCSRSRRARWRRRTSVRVVPVEHQRASVSGYTRRASFPPTTPSRQCQ